MTTIGTPITWNGLPHFVTGYVVVGEQLITLWLVDTAGNEYKLRRGELRQVKPTKT